MQKLLSLILFTLACLLQAVTAQWGSGETEHVMQGLGDKFDPKNPTEPISEATLLAEQAEDATHKAYAATRSIIEKYEKTVDTLDKNISNLQWNRGNAQRALTSMEAMCKTRYCQYYNTF